MFASSTARRAPGPHRGRQTYYERCVRHWKELRAGEAALESGGASSGASARTAPVLFGALRRPVLAKLPRNTSIELELSFNEGQ